MLETILNWFTRILVGESDLEAIKCPYCGLDQMDDMTEINESNQLEMTCRNGHKFEYAI